MSRILLLLSTFTLLIISSHALYKHQAGLFNWEIKTIGDIDRIQYLNNRAAFITKDGFYGVFSTANGI